ncbi:hypothetical protein [Aliarcobacter butzleri]|uniref:hypothetical protein n=1 Tax=Aliarcobacter butzleri TaxID=28197 RepID=UPI001EDBF489|nr:hypothetical protein [Aliarcobacter butzleri]MCG3682436.1 hypothetical protein [Aliarcobacter butzleri]
MSITDEKYNKLKESLTDIISNFIKKSKDEELYYKIIEKYPEFSNKIDLERMAKLLNEFNN